MLNIYNKIQCHYFEDAFKNHKFVLDRFAVLSTSKKQMVLISHNVRLEVKSGELDGHEIDLRPIY